MATAAPVNVKKEPGLDASTSPDPEYFQERIMALLKEHPGDITIEIIKANIPQATAHNCMEALNALLKKSQIKVFKKKLQGKEVLVYRLNDPASASCAVKGADMEEKIVYQVIANAGNKGIWTREISRHTNLPGIPLKKLLKTLQSKKLVKEVACVNAAKKKVFMLYDLVPDSSVTGGAWYNDNTFDQEFADVLNQRCFRFLEEKAEAAKEKFSDDEPYARYNAGQASAEEIHQHIRDLGISTISLDVQDIVAVLNTLVWDGKVKETTKVSAGTTEHNKMYHVARPMIKTAGLVKVPCSFCPLINECRDDGPISPKTCVYMKEWQEKLDF